MKKLRRIFLIGLVALGLLCLLAASISFISNQFMPSGPAALDRLELVDKNRLSEITSPATSLRRNHLANIWRS